jgi:putative endonuclease
MFYLYIIYSFSIDKYYIGISGDILHRLKQHNAVHKGFTAKANDWKIMYSETFENKQLAAEREKEIKRWKSRVKIEKLISTNNIG